MPGQSRGLRVLLVAPHFAPSAIVGAKRFAFLAQQFERLGHEVETLTLKLRSNDRRDGSLPQAGIVHPIASLLPVEVQGQGLLQRAYDRVAKTVIGYPDHYIGWLPPSALIGRQIVWRFRPDVVIATGPPFTAFLTGLILSRASGAGLILDYRDPWTAFDWPSTPRGLRMKSPMRRRMERRVVRGASAAVFATAIMRDRFEALHVGPRPDRLEVITNGFLPPAAREAVALTPGAVNILYAGNFYGERRLAPLMEALKCVDSDGSSGVSRFAMHVFGRIQAEDRRRISDIGMGRVVHEHAPVEHAEILRHMAAADLLFLPSGGDVAYALPYKVFDYLSVRRPILAVTPAASAVAQLVQELDCGEVSTADDASTMAAAILRLIERRGRYSFAGAEQYTWDRVALRYDALMRAAAGQRR